jgi:hypothetical protein
VTGARRLSAAAAALGLLVVVAASCSIPTQKDPSSIPASKVPFDLLDPHLPTTTTTQPKPSSPVSVQVFFITYVTQQLQSELRVVAAPAPLASIISAMLAGPTSAESSSVYSAIPSDVSVISATPASGNVVIVNMNTPFAEIPGPDLELAVGQIVATVATENGPGTGVLFEIEGQRTPVPIANGSDAARPVYLLDFVGGPARS